MKSSDVKFSKFESYHLYDIKCLNMLGGIPSDFSSGKANDNWNPKYNVVVSKKIGDKYEDVKFFHVDLESTCYVDNILNYIEDVKFLAIINLTKEKVVKNMFN